MEPTVEDLRALARASRRSQRAAFAAMAGTLALFPALAVVWTLRPSAMAWAAYAATSIAGALLVTMMLVAGRERGLYRRVFRRLRDEWRAQKRA